jgi:hypothetical protein
MEEVQWLRFYVSLRNDFEYIRFSTYTSNFIILLIELKKWGEELWKGALKRKMPKTLGTPWSINRQ